MHTILFTRHALQVITVAFQRLQSLHARVAHSLIVLYLSLQRHTLHPMLPALHQIVLIEEADNQQEHTDGHHILMGNYRFPITAR